MKLAVIPARGGSKRIPRKNIRIFHGKPIIAYSINAAIESNFFDKIIVSTDDKEIASIAESFGAEVPYLRPPEISDDYANTIDVINHSINWFLEKKQVYEDICCIYPCAPFITPEDLRNGYKMIQHKDVNFSFAAVEFPISIDRALEINKDGYSVLLNEEKKYLRSQDAKKSYHDAGQFYWGKKDCFLNKLSILSSKSKPIILPRERAQDIDTFEDWNLAEIQFLNLIKKNS